MSGLVVFRSAPTWTPRASAVDNDWYSVCWSPERGLFCAVANTGVGNRVMTSPDGITWTIRAGAVDNDWYSVCWSPERGLFCAVAITGVGNRAMTSPDGITWTTRVSAADNQWLSVCWSPERGLFCAVANTGVGNRVMTSPDGITWTTRVSAADNAWYFVCWSPERGLFCAVAYTGVGNRVMTSDVVRLEVTDFQETAPIKVGETARAFAGGARSSVRAEKRTFTATTPPIGKTEYDALLADCALEADVVVTGNCLLGASLTCKVRPTYKLVGVGTAVAGYNFTYAVTLAIEEA